MTMTAPTPAGATAALPLKDALQIAADLIRESLAGASFTRMNDDENVEALDGFEVVGRLVDAGRVGTAHQVEERSARHLGRESLAWKRGCKSGRDLITRVTGVSGKEAARRINLGNRVQPRPQGGTVLPPLFPAVNAALTAGLITLDQADVIVNGLTSLTNHCTPDDLAAAENALIASAIGAADAETASSVDSDSADGTDGADGSGDVGAERNTGFAFSADLLRIQVNVWKARLDPDGTAPNEEPSEARSNFGFGRIRNGLYPLRGGVTPEMRGVLNGLFDTYLSAHAATPSFPSKKEQATFDQIVAQRDQDIENREGIEAGEIIPGAELDTEFAGPARPIGEKRADILRAALERITRDADTPTLGGAAPTVMVHVNAQDLASNTGVGWIDGVEDPINLKTVRQMMCAGGYQTIIYGDDGDILHLGGKQRCFTTNQRKAIIARDGGCIIPGCNAPVSWVELHHVT
ncbi:HNH endonuclease signature motif containing protein, partial [Glaciibacter superstes]|uniref:HNH endonuclease signature motif containing protein n=1 Tax=Glaciibacter superstes TaxID=501023 RepID=UPI0003B520ED